uniref:Cupin domain-like protein 166 n=1 Tax=Saccoglossus kowalevskii TaxID=10224 RepID=A0A1L7H7P7_SACKO|nr:cupin domain-like protein 166 [Saccoglossus kowalevskii]
MASHGLTDDSGDLMRPGGDRNAVRNVCTSKIYLITKNSPIAYLHQNKSDIVRYHQSGGTVLVYTVSPDGKLHQHRLGMHFNAGDVLQVVTPGGFWEALELVDGDWALQGEAVAPGFDYRDMILGTKKTLSQFSEDIKDILRLHHAGILTPHCENGSRRGNPRRLKFLCSCITIWPRSVNSCASRCELTSRQRLNGEGEKWNEGDVGTL